MINIHFEYPNLFWFLLLVPIYLYAMHVSNKKKKKLISEIFNIISVPSIKANKSLYFWRNVLTSLTLILLIITITKPQWGRKEIEANQMGVSIALTLDLSNSMLAEDIPPSRLDNIKRHLSYFLDNLRGNEVGIVGFAGSAFIASPLTTDITALKQYVQTLHPKLLRRQGTDIGNAINMSLKLLENSYSPSKVIILISDGENHGTNLEEISHLAYQKKIIIYTISIGTPNGSPIIKVGENGEFMGYLRDNSGEVVITRPDFKALQDIANTTGGKYIVSLTGELHLDKIYLDIQSREKAMLGQSKLSSFEDRYFLFLSLALLLFSFEWYLAFFYRRQ